MRALPFAFRKSSAPPSGAWYESLAAGDVTVGLINYTGVIRNTPVTLSAGNVTKLAVYKYTNSGKNVRVGLYKSDRSLVVQGVITTSATGWVEVSVTSTAVSAGAYMLVVNAVADGDTIGYSTTISTRNSANGTYNPLPDPLPADGGSAITGAFAVRAWVE